jgi:hypothetical protein
MGGTNCDTEDNYWQFEIEEIEMRDNWKKNR